MSMTMTTTQQQQQQNKKQYQQRYFLSTSSMGMKPWPVPKVECHGDYRDEAWLEEHIGGPLYEHQASLPRLPVPTLQDTLTRFLPTALPLAKSSKEASDLQTAVDRFLEQATPLQERLLARQQDTANANSSWLQHWWNTLGYLQVRDSVVINVSYYFQFTDDPTARTSTQRGAALLAATEPFRRRVASGTCPAETVGRKERAKPICSTPYKYMFNSCRIPKLNQDSVLIYDPSNHVHAIVAIHGQFYAMDLAHPTTGQPHTVAALERGLETCLQMAQQMHPELPQLGWLTSQDRDSWAQNRQALLEAAQSMGMASQLEQAMEVLQSGSVMLCLDQDKEIGHRAQHAAWLLHGGTETGQGPCTEAANRWFDKSIQLMVSKNGKAGMLGEHSLMDGMPVVQYADYITKPNARYGNASNNDNSAETAAVRPVFDKSLLEQLAPHMNNRVEQAKQKHVEIVSQHELNVQSFRGYGSSYIKKAGYSPDAYVQMAMQLATFRLWDGEQAGTYEATQVRPFLHGRTETTRSVSTQSAAFCQAMGVVPQGNEDDAAIRQYKLNCLREAVQTHVRYIGLAAQAQGVDRHFLGLALLVQDHETPPDLFQNEVYLRAKRWRVSTSNLTHPRFDNWGYGQVVPDGVGLSYSVHSDHCVFGVTALKVHNGWPSRLCHLLEEALLEMKTLIDLEQQATSTRTPQSKL